MNIQELKRNYQRLHRVRKEEVKELDSRLNYKLNRRRVLKLHSSTQQPTAYYKELR